MPLGEYTLVRVVGKGSYGEVSLVRHRHDGKQVKDGARRPVRVSGCYCSLTKEEFKNNSALRSGGFASATGVDCTV